MKRYLLLLNLLCSFLFGWTQTNWIDYLPYKSVQQVVMGSKYVYGSTQNSIIQVDPETESLITISKLNGLSDVGITAIYFHNETNRLVIGYSNGNIDLLDEQGNIKNISDLYRADLQADKSINSIIQHDNNVYLSTSFGIIVLNLVDFKDEIKDTYFIGENSGNVEINALTFHNDSVFAATTSGVYFSSLAVADLGNFNFWQKYPSVNGSNSRNLNWIGFINDTLFVNESVAVFNGDTLFKRVGTTWKYETRLPAGTNYEIQVRNSDLIIGRSGELAFYDFSFNKYQNVYTYSTDDLPEVLGFCGTDNPNNFWIADRFQGMIYNQSIWNNNFYAIESISTTDVVAFDSKAGNTWIVPGARPINFKKLYRPAEINGLVDGYVLSYSNRNNTVIDTISDLVSVAINPTNPTNVYAGSIGDGLVEIIENEVVKIYNSINTPAIKNVIGTPNGQVNNVITALEFDNQGSLWIGNSGNQNLLAQKIGDKFYSYSFAGYNIDNAVIVDMAIDPSGSIWCALNLGYGILVFNNNDTPENLSDDEVKVLGFGPTNGDIPGSTVTSLELDNNGQVWVGTDAGVGVFYTYSNVFESNFQNVEIPLVQQADGYTEKLLVKEYITGIAVDGANRKWFGTENAGVYLMSENGTELINHFTSENSSLISNEVKAIEINQKNGEVFIGTQSGIVAIMGDATESKSNFSAVEVFPNPVYLTQHEQVVIRGLMENSAVNITDASGNLVYQANSLGGSVTWNLKNQNSDSVAPGVYLVLATDEIGRYRVASKIMILQ